MKKWQYKIYIIIFTTFLISCSTEEPDPAIAGNWQLTNLLATLDGSNLIEIPIKGFEPKIDGTSYSYNTRSGKESGTWVVNDSGTSLKVEFEGFSHEYPILMDSPTEIQFIIKSLDLTQSLTIEESNLLAMLNQKLLATGSSWSNKATSATTLEIILTLKNQ